VSAIDVGTVEAPTIHLCWARGSTRIAVSARWIKSKAK
jgi:hypothetical protein